LFGYCQFLTPFGSQPVVMVGLTVSMTRGVLKGSRSRISLGGFRRRGLGLGERWIGGFVLRGLATLVFSSELFLSHSTGRRGRGSNPSLSLRLEDPCDNQRIAYRSLSFQDLRNMEEGGETLVSLSSYRRNAVSSSVGLGMSHLGIVYREAEDCPD